jgi:hypothetical protein
MTTPIDISTPIEQFSPFLPTTYNLPEDDRLNVFLEDNFANMSDVINDKKIGTIVQTSSQFNGEKWFYKTTGITRNGYSVIAYIPSYPASGVLTLTLTSTPMYPIPNVNNEFVITDLYGTASKPPTVTGAGNGNFFKFNNQGDSRISFTMSDNTIVITTTTDLSAYSGFIVVQYLRNGL